MKLEFEIFCQKFRQIEGTSLQSALLSQNVNKLSRFLRGSLLKSELVGTPCSRSHYVQKPFIFLPMLSIKNKHNTQHQTSIYFRLCFSLYLFLQDHRAVIYISVWLFNDSCRYIGPIFVGTSGYHNSFCFFFANARNLNS